MLLKIFVCRFQKAIKLQPDQDNTSKMQRQEHSRFVETRLKVFASRISFDIFAVPPRKCPRMPDDEHCGNVGKGEKEGDGNGNEMKFSDDRTQEGKEKRHNDDRETK